MPSYTISILDLEVTFRTDAGPERVERAKALLEDRYRKLNSEGRNLSKEKLLIYVALGLADDLILSFQKHSELEAKMSRLLTTINSLKTPLQTDETAE